MREVLISAWTVAVNNFWIMRAKLSGFRGAVCTFSNAKLMCVCVYIYRVRAFVNDLLTTKV